MEVKVFFNNYLNPSKRRFKNHVLQTLFKVGGLLIMQRNLPDLKKSVERSEK